MFLQHKYVNTTVIWTMQETNCRKIAEQGAGKRTSCCIRKITQNYSDSNRTHFWQIFEVME